MPILIGQTHRYRLLSLKEVQLMVFVLVLLFVCNVEGASRSATFETKNNNMLASESKSNDDRKLSSPVTAFVSSSMPKRRFGTKRKTPLFFTRIDSTDVTASRSSQINRKRSSNSNRLFLSSESTDLKNIDNGTDDYEDGDNAATLRSVVFCYVPKDKEPELLCDFLMEIGACSTSIVDADLGTDLEVPVFREFDKDNNMNPMTSTNTDAWEESLQWASKLWNRCNVTAHFPNSIDLPYIFDMVQECVPEFPIQSYKIKSVPNMDWVIHVQQSWKPIIIGNQQFLLTFPWHTKEDINEVLKKQQQPTNDNNDDNQIEQHANKKLNDLLVELKLRGGIAFGTGEHPTTQLCLEWIHEEVLATFNNNINNVDTKDNNIINVMDYGTGSGVLGLGACALARKLHEKQVRDGREDDTTSPLVVRAVGTDIDIDAIQIANANAADNGLQDVMSSYLPPLSIETDNDDDVESKSLLLKAHAHAQKQLISRKNEGVSKQITSTETKQECIDDDDNNDDVSEEYSSIILPDHLQGPIYDICVANILAGPLITLSNSLFALIKPGGKLGMSGILSHQANDVVDAYKKASFHDVSVRKELNGWVLVTGTKK